jgi:hypothetical protein
LTPRAVVFLGGGVRDVRALQAWVEDCARVMRLSDWTFHVEIAQGMTATARIGVVDALATIELCPDFGTLAPEIQRRTIAHEMVHLHYWSASDVFHAIRREVPAAASRLARRLFREADELATDSLAEVIAPLLPLPPS